MKVILDSSILCAYANKDDVHHDNSIEILRRLLSQKESEVIITDHIFDEVVSVTKRKSNKDNSINIGEALLNSEVELAYTDDFIFAEAWNIFKQKNEFSFTDCTIIAFMKVFGINKIATFDKEFSKVKDFEIINS